MSSNSSFSGVSKEIYGRVNAGTVSAASLNAGTVRTGTINCDSVQISLPQTAATVKITWTTGYYSMTTADMALMARGQVLLDDNAQTGAGVLVISTADTAVEALRLLALFNITDTSTTRLITFSHINALAGGMGIISIGANAAVVGVDSKIYVQYKLKGGSAAVAGTIMAAAAVRDAYVLVYRGADVANAKTIVFDVIGYAAS